MLESVLLQPRHPVKEEVNIFGEDHDRAVHYLEKYVWSRLQPESLEGAAVISEMITHIDCFGLTFHNRQDKQVGIHIRLWVNAAPPHPFRDHKI